MYTCKICNHAGNNEVYHLKEMMFDLKDSFEYFRCANCECLQIVTIPSNISEYYPKTYYTKNLKGPDTNNVFVKYLKNIRNNYALTHKGIFGRLIYSITPNTYLKFLGENTHLNKSDKILDVGCGKGYLLHDLRNLGFTNTLGIDPFNEKNITYSNGLEIQKKGFNEMESDWDFIMMHHSFEHMPNPIETFCMIEKLLKKGGQCLIRIPTVSSFAWEHYKENWVQLDAPRHLFLHSIKSITFLSELAKLQIDKILYDSNEFQFWGSEQYIQNISLFNERSYGVNKKNSIFTTKEIQTFKRKAEQLNKEKKGDSIAIFLSKK